MLTSIIVLGMCKIFRSTVGHHVAQIAFIKTTSCSSSICDNDYPPPRARQSACLRAPPARARPRPPAGLVRPPPCQQIGSVVRGKGRSHHTIPFPFDYPQLLNCKRILHAAFAIGHTFSDDGHREREREREREKERRGQGRRRRLANFPEKEKSKSDC